MRLKVRYIKMNFKWIEFKKKMIFNGLNRSKIGSD